MSNTSLLGGKCPTLLSFLLEWKISNTSLLCKKCPVLVALDATRPDNKPEFTRDI